MQNTGIHTEYHNSNEDCVFSPFSHPTAIIWLCEEGKKLELSYPTQVQYNAVIHYTHVAYISSPAASATTI